ncbi:SMP-30/gluconolactonase/LRE family protein [Paracoccus shanxieyensis]|uniref:SMP-30/gluconolactonase/LRE family protein n=1 Tax=Paracoccus shanxieyensis TaxID=2675752 RepID=A0A6L6J3G5_9RHOB|nr:SMP-30/gluconolactonase/LRE family protein [Paracoccus shanxieyensis]MTH65287.1 SMP-30/gluconolactonase/LRE family protein [Paracoccus shanxieyensis]MTH88409.1 SMP-30/gluconolactonase/LRE family protein [Paracoccus shanxieyensis]
MRSTLFDPRICQLGEGAFWHPERQQPFWFDILGRRLLSRDHGRELEWRFDERVSAAGWIDRDTLLIASETALFRFDLRDGSREHVTPLEADNPRTRSNDGRADPFGGFWIGTMALDGSPEAGAIYRFHRGKLVKLRDRVSIPNAICFSPDGATAYYADTHLQTVWQQSLDGEGWPAGDPQVFLDFSGSDEYPDGAVTDAQGNFWNARWGTGRLACHAPDGRVLDQISLPAAQVTCPAFMGERLDRILLTSAAVDLDGAEDGRSWLVLPDGPKGLPEPRVLA